MKKFSSFLILLALLMSAATSVSGQVRFGVKAGLNLANISGDITDTKMNPTFMVGGQAEFGLSDALGLGVGLQLHGKGFKIDLDGENATSSPLYIQVPVYLMYRNSGFFGGVGPYVGFGVGGKSKFSGESQSISFGSTVDDDFSSLDFGAGLELGYEFGSLRASASYNLGLSNVIPKDAASGFDISARHNVIGIALAYLFGGE